MCKQKFETNNNFRLCYYNYPPSLIFCCPTNLDRGKYSQYLMRKYVFVYIKNRRKKTLSIVESLSMSHLKANSITWLWVVVRGWFFFWIVGNQELYKILLYLESWRIYGLSSYWWKSDAQIFFFGFDRVYMYKLFL